MEGVTLGLGYGLNRFRELGIQPTEIRLTGGGSQSAVWRQIAADIFGVPTICLASAEGAALGAALQGGLRQPERARPPTTFRGLAEKFVKLDEATRAKPTPTTRSSMPSCSPARATPHPRRCTRRITCK